MSNLATHLAEQDAITAQHEAAFPTVAHAMQARARCERPEAAEPRTFVIHIAQDIRAYGYVEVEAAELDAAIAKVNHAYVREHFTPHGSGSDDFDYDNARAVCLTQAFEDDTGLCEDLDIELPDEHIEKSRRALIRAAAALHNAANALNIARDYAFPQNAPQEIDSVQDDINEALDAIAAEVGDKAMLEASA